MKLLRVAYYLVAVLSVAPAAFGGTDQVRPVFGSSTGTLNGISKSTLRGSGTSSTEFNVRNDGGPTVFSVTPEEDFNGAFNPVLQPVDMAIETGELVSPGFAVEFDRTVPSGTYSLLTTLQSPGDSDNDVLITMRHYDTADLIAMPDPIDVDFDDGQFSITNSPAPAGGLRAAAEITNTSVTRGFSVTGLANGTTITPGNSVSGVAQLDRRGLLAGDQSGNLRLFSRAVGDQSLGFNPRANFALTGNVPERNVATIDVVAGQDYGDIPDLGLNGVNTAVTIPAGTSTSNQQISLAFTDDPAAGLRGEQPRLLSDVAQVTFTQSENGLYIMQMTYNPLLIPAEVEEQDLRLFAFSGTDWVNAVSLNSDGGAGGELFFGSVESYLSSLGGGQVGGGGGNGIRLSDHGIDFINNRVWAVLEDFGIDDDEPEDYFATAEEFARLFLADFDNDGDVDGEDFLVWQRNFPLLSGATADIGDADGDGDVDGEDFLIWQSMYPAQAGRGASAAVPEPSALSVAIGCLLLTMACTRSNLPPITDRKTESCRLKPCCGHRTRALQP